MENNAPGVEKRPRSGSDRIGSVAGRSLVLFLAMAKSVRWLVHSNSNGMKNILFVCRLEIWTTMKRSACGFSGQHQQAQQPSHS